jgi:ribosome maturation factor RimP
MKTNIGRGKQGVEKTIEDLALRVLNDLDLELVGIEYKPYKGRVHLVVYIDKPGGVFLEDCEHVSKFLGELLDREDPIPYSYVLEVSSPGVERPLMKKTDFDRFKGNYVKIKTFLKINGQKNFVGELKGLQNDSMALQTDEGEMINISLKDISKANLFFK